MLPVWLKSVDELVLRVKKSPQKNFLIKFMNHTLNFYWWELKSIGCLCRFHRVFELVRKWHVEYPLLSMFFGIKVIQNHRQTMKSPNQHAFTQYDFSEKFPSDWHKEFDLLWLRAYPHFVARPCRPPNMISHQQKRVAI